AGTLLVRDGEKAPLTVKLHPWGVVIGKLLNPDGKLPADVYIGSSAGQGVTAEGVMPRPLNTGSLPDLVQVDKDGRFRVEGLVLGLNYNLQVMKGNFFPKLNVTTIKNVSVKSGETRDLGDVPVKWPDK